MRKIKPRKVQFQTTGDSLTHQSERTQADINVLVKRGIMPPDPNQLRFEDFSDGADFQAVQDSIIEARETFESLPSDIRDKFENDPAKLIDFVNDPEKQLEAAKLGLIKPLPAEDSINVKEPSEEATDPPADSSKKDDNPST